MSGARPKRFAVVGDPIGHSKSPAMHAAAYGALGLPHTYEAIHASVEDLPHLVRALREGAYDGLNVTVPHKQNVLAWVDRCAEGATEAANTLVRGPDGSITAHNTDAPALAEELWALAPELRSGASSATALVLGTGGAARAAVLALRWRLGVGRILVRGRSPQAAPLEPSPPLEPEVRIVVQATSAGMTGADPGDVVANAVAWDALPADAIALDLVYSPPETPFLARATAYNLRHANGLGMLARQGALAFELWLGLPAPLDVMRRALT
jgi:shikimate dehydrogenase